MEWHRGGGDVDIDFENAATVWDLDPLQEKYKAGTQTLSQTGSVAATIYWFQVGKTYLSNVALISEVTLYCRANLRDVETKEPIYLGIWAKDSSSNWKRVATSLNQQTPTNNGTMVFKFLATPMTGPLRFCPLLNRYDKWPDPPTLQLGLLVNNSNSITDTDTFCRTELAGSTNPHWYPKFTVKYANKAELAISSSSSSGSSDLPAGNNFDNPIIGAGATGENYSYTVALGMGASAGNTDAVAIGHNAQATGLSSLAIGGGAKATGEGSIVLGYSVTNTYSDSVLIKVGNYSPGNLKLYFYGPNSSLTSNSGGKAGMAYQVNYDELKYISFEDLFSKSSGGGSSLPSGNTFDYPTIGQGATGNMYSVTLGNAANTGSYRDSVAIGIASNTTGTGAISIGSSATAAQQSIALGYMAKATKTYSTAIGYGAQASTGSTAIGYNAINSYQDTVLLRVGQEISNSSASVLNLYFYGPNSSLSSNTDKKAGVAYSIGGTTKYISFEDLFTKGSTTTGSSSDGIPFATQHIGYTLGSNSFVSEFSLILGDGVRSSYDGKNTVVVGNNVNTKLGSIAVGNGVNVDGLSSTVVGVAGSTQEDQVVVLSAASYQYVDNYGDGSNKGKRTLFYIVSAGSELSSQFLEGKAGIGYVVENTDGTVDESGCIDLKSICTKEFIPKNGKPNKNFNYTLNS